MMRFLETLSRRRALLVFILLGISASAFGMEGDDDVTSSNSGKAEIEVDEDTPVAELSEGEDLVDEEALLLHIAGETGLGRLTQAEHLMIIKQEEEISPSQCLLLAAKDQEWEAVKHLLNKKGVDLTTADENGWTALHFAARYGDLSMLTLLVEQRATIVYLENQEGQTALHLAAQRGDLEMVKYLFAARSRGRTIQSASLLREERTVVLCTAAEYGHMEIVEYVLNEGMLRNPDGIDLSVYKSTTLRSDSESWDTDPKKRNEIAKDPVRLANMGAVFNLTHTALSFAVANGHWEIAKYLIDNGANPLAALHFILYRSETKLEALITLSFLIAEGLVDLNTVLDLAGLFKNQKVIGYFSLNQ